MSGGGGTSTPAPPPAPPSLGSQIKGYVKQYPKLYGLQETYAPKLAGLDFSMFQKYAPQYAKEAVDLQQKYYPQTSALQENLAGQAMRGMNEPVPQELKQQFISDFNSQLGMNVNAPLGITDRNVALLNLQKQWGDYYRNLGLSLAQRQPLQELSKPGGIQFQSPNEFFPNALNYGASTYGSYANAYVNQPIMQQSNPWGSIAGAGLGIAAGMLCWVASEIYGGWTMPKTEAARAYMVYEAPEWLLNLYAKYGERVAKFLKAHPILKKLIKPLFDRFAEKGWKYLRRAS